MKNLKIYRNISQYLKLIICRKSPAKKVIWIYFSELAPELGEGRPFLDAEFAYLNKYADIALVGGFERFMHAFRNSSGVPGIFLPLTAFVDLNQFFPQNKPKKYDICFYAPFNHDGIKRKHVDLFLKVLESDKTLSAVWIGGYNIEEKWLIESTYDKMIKEYKISFPLNAGKCLTKKEFLEYGWFTKKREQEQIGIFNKYKADISNKKINLTLLFGLKSKEVAKILNQSKTALVLSKRSGCLRSITEALAADVPVIVCSDLNASKDFINSETGIISNRNTGDLIKNIHYLLKNRNKYHPRKWFSKSWGLEKCVSRLIKFSESLKLKFDAICSLPYLPELLLRRAVRLKDEVLGKRRNAELYKKIL